jgi:hypothetical protein
MDTINRNAVIPVILRPALPGDVSYTLFCSVSMGEIPILCRKAEADTDTNKVKLFDPGAFL